MLKYHVAVCDDEKSDLDGIVQSVQQYDVQGCFDIETYMDGNELLSELQMQKKCQNETQHDPPPRHAEQQNAYGTNLPGGCRCRCRAL